MLLRHTAQLNEEAQAVDAAVRTVIGNGYRTRDLARGGDGEKVMGTAEMGSLILDSLKTSARPMAQAV
ncbi:MAG: isocitrate/isopropylmalate family dehydrogenase [Pyrinomonadaceae bacterium]